METKKPYQLYEEEFKKSIVTLYQNGKSQSQLSKEYGISTSAISKWIKQYSTVKTEDGDVLTAKQIKELQKRNAQLEEENLILKKAIAIFTPHSINDQKLYISCATNTTSKLFAEFLKSTAVLITNIFIQIQHLVQRKIRLFANTSCKSILITTTLLVLIRSVVYQNAIMALTSVSAECTA